MQRVAKFTFVLLLLFANVMFFRDYFFPSKQSGILPDNSGHQRESMCGWGGHGHGYANE